MPCFEVRFFPVGLDMTAISRLKTHAEHDSQGVSIAKRGGRFLFRSGVVAKLAFIGHPMENGSFLFAVCQQPALMGSGGFGFLFGLFIAFNHPEGRTSSAKALSCRPPFFTGADRPGIRGDVPPQKPLRRKLIQVKDNTGNEKGNQYLYRIDNEHAKETDTHQDEQDQTPPDIWLPYHDRSPSFHEESAKPAYERECASEEDATVASVCKSNSLILLNAAIATST
jgi:hypothetical protein